MMDATITIHGLDDLTDDEHLYAALKLITWHHPIRADIFIDARTPEGWIEYTVKLVYSTGGGMTIGVIQRRPGAPVEYHS
jgi:hypothetical protein